MAPAAGAAVSDMAAKVSSEATAANGIRLRIWRPSLIHRNADPIILTHLWQYKIQPSTTRPLCPLESRRSTVRSTATEEAWRGLAEATAGQYNTRQLRPQSKIRR